MPPPSFADHRQTFPFDGGVRQRVTMVECRITRRKNSPKRDDVAPLVLIDQARGAVDPFPEHTVGGHLIGLKLGGPDTAENLVPMYAGFNGTTYKAMEKGIFDDVTITDMKVLVSYRCLPPNLPSQFTIYVRREGGPFQRHAVLSMAEEPAPIRYVCRDTAEVTRIVQFAQRKIQEQKWIDFKAANPLFLGLKTGRYEFLDYLYLEKDSAYKVLCYYFDVEKTEFLVGKGMNFHTAQIDMIKKLNWFLNGDVVRSDNNRAVLLGGSSTLSPHIDHVLPKTTGSGPNLFSNARVTSASENMSKGIKRIADHLNDGNMLASSSSASSSGGANSLDSTANNNYDGSKKAKYSD